jgi:hypothetical protein
VALGVAVGYPRWEGRLLWNKARCQYSITMVTYNQGGQSYRARAAKVSIIRFSHSNWTALKTLSLELL